MIDVFTATKREKERGGEPKKIKHPHIFYSYLENPNISFEEQEEGEIALLILRRHFLTNIHWMLITMLLFFIPLLFIPFSSSLSVFNFLELPVRFVLIFAIFYYLVIFTYAFVNFITWYFNVALITNKKVIDVDFSKLVYKNVAATKHSLLQDASYSQIGVLRSLFDYGDVMVQTAGSLENFEFPAVPNPERVVRIVEEQIGAERR